MPRSASPQGHATRGTTGTNRLRRVDRWIASRPEFRNAAAPTVIDLGFGASGVTTFELATRLLKTRQDATVIGIEIDRDRVRTANEQLERVRAGESSFSSSLPVSFTAGGFELGQVRGATIVRAMNVLRQYDEADVPAAWAEIASHLSPDGLLIEGTCNEVGRVGSWLDIGHEGVPLRFTISLRLDGLDRPSVVAERLPKALIHRNVDGERVRAFLGALDDAWALHTPLGTFGPSQRWIATVRTVKDAGWPVLGTASRWRLGEVTVPWSSVSP